MKKFFLTAISTVLLFPSVAFAATGGGKLPWSNFLSIVRDDLTGVTAFSLAIIASVAAGITYAFSHEMSGAVKAIVIITFILSIVTGIVNIAAAFGIAGATFTPAAAMVTGGSF